RPGPRRDPRRVVPARGEPSAPAVARLRPHRARHGGDAAALAGPGRARCRRFRDLGGLGDPGDPAGSRRRRRSLVGEPRGDAPGPGRGGRAMRKSASAYFHPSNAVTYLSLLAGLLAVVTAKEWRSWSAAGGLLALSALADTLDGRFARLFRRDSDQQRFGVELDSLADAVTFG